MNQRKCRDCPRILRTEGQERLCPKCLAHARRSTAKAVSKRRYYKLWAPTTRLCVDCGATYEIARKPGRPFVRCKKCRS